MMRSAKTRVIGFVSLAALAALATACQASVSAKASTAGDAEVKGDQSWSSSGDKTTTPAPSAAPADTTAPASPPPPNKCPLSCYAANGADRLEITKEEHDAIESGIEPALAKMRSCTSGEGDAWRRHGSPTIQLRVEPDGDIHEVDVDPHHRYEYERSCIDDAARSTPVSIPMPGRTAVRCVERCAPPPTATQRRIRRTSPR